MKSTETAEADGMTLNQDKKSVGLTFQPTLKAEVAGIGFPEKGTPQGGHFPTVVKHRPE